MELILHCKICWFIQRLQIELIIAIKLFTLIQLLVEFFYCMYRNILVIEIIGVTPD